MRSLGSMILAFLVLTATGAAQAGRAADVRTQAFKDLNQGVSAYKRGEYELAVEKLSRSASAALNSFRAHFYLGLALIGDRRYADALDALEVALDLDPDHLPALVATGDSWLKQGDLSEASAAYLRALKQRAEFPAALDGLARVREARSADDEAIRYYLRAIRSDRGFAPAYTHLGDLYLRQQRFEDAIRLLEEAVSVRPDFAAGLNRLAVAYGRLGMNSEAVAAVRQAMEIQPRAASHRATLGLLQLGQGSVAGAERWFLEALGIDPLLPDARLGLAEVARRRGEYELSLGQLDVALADERLDARDRQRLEDARNRIESERFEFDVLEARVGDGSAGAEDVGRLAAIFAGRRNWSRAVELQQRVEDGPAVRERLAYLLFQDGRYREAHELYAALASGAAEPRLDVNNGVTLARLGNDRNAVEAFRRALEGDPQDASARLYLGNALLRLGERESAVEAYATFLRSGTGGEAAERVRRILMQIAPETLPAESADPFSLPPEPDGDVTTEDEENPS